MMYLDGVYTFDEGKAKFHFITLPDQLELDNLLNTISQRVVKLLEKRGWLVKDETDQEFLSIESPEAIESIHGSSITYRIALGKYRGQRALTLQAVPRVTSDNKFLAKASGFSLHAGVACKSDERKKRERICRYISRPSLSEGQLSLNARGQVVYKLKKTYNNGTSHWTSCHFHLVMTGGPIFNSLSHSLSFLFEFFYNIFILNLTRILQKPTPSLLWSVKSEKSFTNLSNSTRTN